MRKVIFILMLMAAFLLAVQPVLAEPLWKMGKELTINSLSVSEDGTNVAAGTQDATAVLLDKDGAVTYEYAAKNVVTGVSLLASGQMLVASDDQTVSLIGSDGKPVWSKNMKKLVKLLSATADGQVIAVSLFRSNAVLLLDMQGEIVKEIPVGIDITSMQVSAGGEWIAAGGADQYLYLYNREGQLVSKASVTGGINEVAVSGDGITVVGTTENTAVAFDSSGKKLSEIAAKDVITSVHITKDAGYIAYADYSGNYYIGNLSGRELWTAKEAGAGRQIRFSPDGKSLYAASDKGAVFRYDVGHLLQSGEKAAARKRAVQIGAVVAGFAILIGFLIWVKTYKPHIPKRLWKDKYAYFMLLPSFTLIFLFLYYPSFSGLYHSLYKWNPGGRSEFVGLANFQRMLGDPYVAKGSFNLLILIVTGLFKTLVPPLLVAELIYHLRNKRAQYLFRTSFVISMVIPSVGFLLVWQDLYDPNMGLINKTLEAIGLGSLSHPWLGDSKTALWAIIFMGFPFVGIMQLLVMYSGLIAIPEEVIEAVRMDGARPMRIIRSIHLPLLSGQFKLLIVLALIGIVQDFGSILIVTGGGPMDSTYVPALQMYYAATKFSDLGYASALGVSMFLVILLITVLNMKFIKSAE
ncbi:hypothetical protein J31TS4_27550 [Paenibacillus sp. J31TS4]|uniref:ABC transporter permease subunit n=1 Tax=Paenibacillus sp. J31TS4 TaxID=2807195 RepID=UPI001AFDF081|nr:ABC transporter permease subunit [Paenibacillus sp. J31TS4]GIP39475.1 hypothetical protein J31TS4_27550 [Paenibacillus sp. J31TS4]